MIQLLISVLLVLGASIIVDVFYVFYIATVQARTAKAAAFCSACITLAGCTYIFIVDNHWLIIPAVLGHSFGSYIATHMATLMVDKGAELKKS